MSDTNYLICHEGQAWTSVDKTLEEESSAQVFDDVNDAIAQAVELSIDDNFWLVYECDDGAVDVNKIFAIAYYQQTFVKE